MQFDLLSKVLSLNESIKKAENQAIDSLDALKGLYSLILERDINAIKLKKLVIDYAFENNERAKMFFESVKKDSFIDDRYNRSAYKALNRMVKTADLELEYRELYLDQAKELESRKLLLIIDPIANPDNNNP